MVWNNKLSSRVFFSRARELLPISKNTPYDIFLACFFWEKESFNSNSEIFFLFKLDTLSWTNEHTGFLACSSISQRCTYTQTCVLWLFFPNCFSSPLTANCHAILILTTSSHSYFLSGFPVHFPQKFSMSQELSRSYQVCLSIGILAR